MKRRVAGKDITAGVSIVAVACAAAFAAAFAAPALRADEDRRFELEEIVVTGTAVKEPMSEIPKNVTVITARDIEQAPVRNVADLLSREANVRLRSLFGHEKSSGIDLRGMGDTYGSGVVVLVNGFRINSPDMSGFDLSSVPLDSIERIEIVHGSGSVLYGDGAVGGVINIITKKSEAKKIGIGVSYGSYDTKSTDVSFDRKDGKTEFVLTAGMRDTGGYRQNGYLYKKDASVRMGYDLSDYTSLAFTLSPHQDRYGLPGPVSKADAESRETRILTSRPGDGGESTDVTLTTGMETVVADSILLSFDCGYRFRDDRYVMGYTPLLPLREQTDHIAEDTVSAGALLSTEYELFGLQSEVQGGGDLAFTAYTRTERSKNERKNSDIRKAGFFMTNRTDLTKTLALHAGYRFSLYSGTHRLDTYDNTGGVWETGQPFERLWTNHSFDAGMVYDVGPSVSLYADFATSFRTPNVDEFALSDSDLHPQRGIDLEAGGRIRFQDTAELSVSGFYIRITDEIYYGEDPVSGTPVNRNYDFPTNRLGVETSVKVYPFENLFLWGNYTYMDARFENRWTVVPLVPAHKASFGCEWRIVKPLVIALSGTYVGSRFDGNDETNVQYESLHPYTVVDAKVTYASGPFRIYLGVNNLFDELYSTVAYGGQYYPMPERNFYGGVDLEF
ncbi:MAG: TonB-dependent receptor [Spirochaetes bacterium]|nr:TonB-dependent receptor [Spirochaetota bacterium]